MRIVKPFEDQPLWEFYDAEIPDIDYASYGFKTQNQISNLEVLDGDMYNKRMKILGRSLLGDPVYEEIRKINMQVVDQIKSQHKNKNEYCRYDRNGNQYLLYCVNAWDMGVCDPDLIIDKKGFFMGYHYDNRNIKANLFLNLEDNESSTEFLITDEINPIKLTEDTEDATIDSPNEPISYKAPSKKGSGYFYFNTNQLWHKIEVVDDERKISMWGVIIQ